MRKWLCVLLGVALAACAREPGLERAVRAKTTLDFALWRSEQGDAIPWKTFDVAVQELKFDLMLSARASGAEALDREVRAMIDGRPVRWVLRAGWEKRLVRLRSEHDQLEGFIGQNEGLRSQPGSAEADAYLENKLQQLTAQRDRTEREIAEAAATLATWRDLAPARR